MKRKRHKIDLSTIPRGRACEKLTHACLVLEGGAFRGIYTQGVLDYFMQHDLNFDCVVGVSAGALSGLNYVTGQIGRSARINLGYRYDSRYIGTKALAASKSIIRLDFLFQEANEIEPLDEERFYKGKQRYVAVATNCYTGKAEYFEKNHCKEMKNAIKASATMPYIAPYVRVEGIPCIDGGCRNRIPYQWAIEEGYDKIIVIQTRERGFRKREKVGRVQRRIISKWYHDFPDLMETLKNSNKMYNDSLKKLECLSDRGEVFSLTPSQVVTVSRLERNLQKLKDLYDLGCEDAQANMDALQSYLGRRR